MSRIDWRHAGTWSLLGLANALLFTFTKIDPMPWELAVWLVVYVAWYVALVRRRPEAPFAQALATSLLSAVWVTVVQNALYDTYLANHLQYAEEYASLSLGARIGITTLTASAFGLVLGAALGSIVRRRLLRTPTGD